MKTLDKWDNLMIRACKSNGDTIRRLRKIWRKRCALPKGYHVDNGISYHLLSLLNERQNKLDFREWVNILEYSNPESFRNKLWGLETFYDCLLSYLIGQLAITTVKEWDGYISPAKFRKLKKTT